MLVYTLVGIAFGIAATLTAVHYRKIDLPQGKKIWVIALIVIGLLLVGFSLDWAYASLWEKEPQSAAMGILVFGGIGVVIAIIGFRLGIGRKEALEQSPDKDQVADSRGC